MFALCRHVPLVRLAHLFEISAFKWRFRTALNEVLVANFDYLRWIGPLPEHVVQWSADLARFFRECGEGISSKRIAAVLRIDNGPSASERFMHICQGCCQSKMEAFEKMYFAYLGIFIRGFAPPLLYRFKHYEPAKDYLTRGIDLHRILLQGFNAMGRPANYDVEVISKVEGGDDRAAQNIERQTKVVSLLNCQFWMLLSP